MPNPAEPAARFTRLLDRARSHDLMIRPGLSADERAAVILGGLAALPLDPAAFEDELAVLFESGCREELAEDVLTQMAAYLGYPRAQKALAALDRVRPVRKASETAGPSETTDEARFERGTADYARLNPEALGTIEAAFGEIAGSLITLTFQAFGDVYASSRQSLVIRQLATISGLAALGGVAPQLRFHMAAALRVGVTAEQIVEALTWTQFLAGMPAAYNGLVELKAALAAGPQATPGYS